MEFIGAILMLIWLGFTRVILPISLIVLVIHSLCFNTWKENFSPKGLKKHAIDFIFFFFIGIFIMIGISFIKSLFGGNKK